MNPASSASSSLIRQRFAIPTLSLRSGLVDDPSSRQNILTQARHTAAALRTVGDAELIENTNRLMQSHSQLTIDPGLLSLAAGNVLEAVRRSKQIDLYDVQLHAGLVMCAGKVAEMQTGEGKTLSGVLPTYVYALSGKGVHVCTPNAYLASRDQQYLNDIFERLGLTSAVRHENDCLRVAQLAYQADVTYAAGQLFGFDYLRDQWTRREAAGAPLGSSTIERMGGQSLESRLRGRGLFAAIVDEADQVLVDDATSPLVITTSADRPAPDTPLHLHARAVARGLQSDLDFGIDLATSQVNLTDSGFKRVYEFEDAATSSLLGRPWHAYVSAALKAEHVLHRDRHYVIVDRQLRLVESSTGRIFSDRTWSDGLHQAVQAKEGLEITAESASQGRITRQAFFRTYRHLTGMTGTASSCRGEMRSIYRLGVVEIPTRLPSRRQVLDTGIFANMAAKLVALVDEVHAVLQQGRAVLIGTNHVEQTDRIESHLRHHGMKPQVLTGLQPEDEADVIAAAGQPGVITVATHLAGRGTDIPLAESVANAGGLHVIAWEHHRLQRVDRQLIGRGARQGDAGTARFYVSPDDHFVAHLAPYLASTIARCLVSGDNLDFLNRGILAAQRRFETEDRYRRQQLEKRNTRPASAIAQALHGLKGA